MADDEPPEDMTRNYPVNTNNLSPEKKQSLKRAVRALYDYQNLRIGSGNRAVDPKDYELVFDERTQREVKKKKAAPRPGKRTTDEALVVLAEMLGEPQPTKEPPKTLEDADRLRLQNHALILQGLELSTLKDIKERLKDVGVYKSFLKGVPGCGPTLSGVILSEMSMSRLVIPELIPDTVERTYYKAAGPEEFTYFRATITETFEPKRDGDEPKKVERRITCYELEDGTVMEDCCPTVSSLWAYTGLAVDVESGKAVRRRKGQKANWNNFLKSKMVEVLSICMLRAKKKKDDDGNPVNTNYQKLYYDYKHRKESAGWGESKTHRHRAARRYMIKMFLLDLWKAWRVLEGLPTPDSYMEAVLNRRHGDHGGSNLRLV